MRLPVTGEEERLMRSTRLRERGRVHIGLVDAGRPSPTLIHQQTSAVSTVGLVSAPGQKQKRPGECFSNRVQATIGPFDLCSLATRTVETRPRLVLKEISAWVS